MNSEVDFAAGGIVLVNEKILLVKNRLSEEYEKDYDSGFWGYPKGHLDGKETPVEAAEREVYEETGFRVSVTEKKPIAESRYEIKKDGSTNKIIKKVQKRKYNIQRIDGLEEKKVTPPKEVYDRIKKENKLIVNAREINSNLDFFKDKFIMPFDNAIVTGVYGSQRILNGKPRWPHYGLDFAADLGTPIKAMANGIVTLAENDLYYTGATLIFDHGHGISTLYMHMDEIFVEKGDIVKQGEIVGTVGSSGRSTGPHLDIRLNWFGTRLDPATVLDINN